MKEAFASFDSEKDRSLPEELLSKGDAHYLNLFRTEGFIDENSKESESLTPLTNVVHQIYTSLFMKERGHHDTLIIYDELKNLLEIKLGKALAVNGKLQSYVSWKAIREELEVEHEISSAWIENISLESIKHEKHNFSSCTEKELFKIANLRGFGRNNESEVRNYLHHIENLKSPSPYHFVYECTRNSDLLSFKEDIYPWQKLLFKVGIDSWLRLVDSFGYVILQDHMFLYIDELNDYVKIIEIILNAEFESDSEHLLLIALQNFFEFIDRTLIELDGYTTERFYHNEDPDIKRVIEDARTEYEKWTSELIPQSFLQIVKFIFPNPELCQSKYFLSFFEWINTLSKKHINATKLKSRIQLIDLLNEPFQKLLDEQEVDRHFLIDNLNPKQLNWESIKKLIFVHTSNKKDFRFRDKVYEKYLEFIKSENFYWYSSDDNNFELVVNDAFYFSTILCSFPNAFEKWSLLFDYFKIHHEGWLRGSSDFRKNYKECFILTVGVGVAYYHYNEIKSEADEILFSVLKIMIQQIRGSASQHSIDYTTPMRFVAICIGKFANDEVDTFLNLIIRKIDSLKLILIASYELSLNVKQAEISQSTKELLRLKIDNEFWMIERKAADVELKHDLDYYKQLKNEVLKKWQN